MILLRIIVLTSPFTDSLDGGNRSGGWPEQTDVTSENGPAVGSTPACRHRPASNSVRRVL